MGVLVAQRAKKAKGEEDFVGFGEFIAGVRVFGQRHERFAILFEGFQFVPALEPVLIPALEPLGEVLETDAGITSLFQFGGDVTVKEAVEEHQVHRFAYGAREPGDFAVAAAPVARFKV